MADAVESVGTVWPKVTRGEAIRYRCGYCGDRVLGDAGWNANPRYMPNPGLDTLQGCYVRICGCGKPSYIEDYRFSSGSTQRSVTPPSLQPGQDVAGLPRDVHAMYREARISAGAGAYTASIMACRTLLIYVAADVGATAKDLKTFQMAVTWLQDNHWLPPNAARVADSVRAKGNEANHDLKLFDADEAELVRGFTEQLLRTVYQMSSLVPDGDEGEGLDTV